MTRETLENKENDLFQAILELGRMVEEATLEAVDALANRDIEKSKKIYDGDEAINQKRFDIESETLLTIATQQPMATDLRVLASILEVATELERMGDYAKGIGKINIEIGKKPLAKPLVNIPEMAKIATDMLRRALVAFVEGDIDSALAIYKEDDKVDDLFNIVYKDLMKVIVSDPNSLEGVNYLQWAAHNLERMGDRVTNICERTVFIVTGELVELADRE